MCSLASQTCRRTGLLNCCHGIGTIRTCRWSLELGIMLYAIRGPRRVLSFRTTIDGIYSDKKRAPLRELCTNAWDASSDHRFDIHLPSLIDPRVIVRDWGPGLSHDEAMGLYTTLFASTKRDSNDVVGCLGLGSKSPFAYGTQFFVRSFQDGQVRSYSASIEADGVPCLVHMSTKLTTEPDGLEVSFNVKASDIDAFRKAARFTLFGFEPRPNVKNECWEWPDLELVAQGPDWKVY